MSAFSSMSSSTTSIDCNTSGVDCNTSGAERKAQDCAVQGSELAERRAACDGCHAAKIRCTGGTPCARCARDNLKCHYSFKAKIGKPRGSKNKKTIERLRRLNEAAGREPQPQQATSTFSSTASSHARTPQPSTTAIPPLPSCGDDSIQDTGLASRASREPAYRQSSTDINLESPPLQDFIFPNGDLESMDSWLIDMAETCDLHFCGQQSSIEAGHSSDSPSRAGPNPAGDCISTLLHEKPAFQVPSNPCLSPPVSRKSSTSQDFTRQFSDKMGSFEKFPNIMEQNLPCGPPPSCLCFSTLSNHLCTLQALSSTSDYHSQALDALLVQSQRLIPSIEKLFKCQSCTQEPHALFLVNMILSRLLKWTGVSICAWETRHISAEIRLGRYLASAEIGITVTQMLLQKFLSDFKNIIVLFEGAVSQLGHGEADGAYLSLQARNIRLELGRIMERIMR
ncbi:C6 finger domain transcription factor gliZ [Penicillium rolfsii]|nr:C6 finger domain transcription factor gliZ [Penicillium rolfsii]